jgi:hypothetical protein
MPKARASEINQQTLPSAPDKFTMDVLRIEESLISKELRASVVSETLPLPVTSKRMVPPEASRPFAQCHL